MGNILDIYDPLFYANEALIILAKTMGMAGRVHRGYDKNPQEKGSIIKIRRPSTFTAQDAPSTAQDIVASSVQIALSNWKEVKFGLSDKEITLSKPEIITEHITPAAIALADNVDQALASLYNKVGYAFDCAGANMVLADVAGGRKVMFNNKAPLFDAPRLNLMVDGTAEASLLPIMAPNTMLGAQAADVLRNGSIGRVFGFDVFANQNTPSHTSGAIADDVGTLTGTPAIGSTSIAIAAVSISAPIKKGDIFTIAGDPQGYTVTADTTADGAGAVAALPISPALKVTGVNGAVVTFNRNNNTTKVQNLMFHRNAFALASAPLTDMAKDLGARVATVTDPITGLALRSRVYYEGANSKVFVALDILYGFDILDSNLAVRLRA